MNDDKMNRMAVANMSFTLGAMAALETSRSINFGEEGLAHVSLAHGGLALATGTDSASENWAFFPSRNFDENKMRCVCSFFEKLSLPFVWPLFSEADGQILEDAGMPARGELQVMACPEFCPMENNISGSLTFEVNKEADVWAETAWRAFDSPPGAPASFVNLARGLMKNKNFFLILAKKDGVPAGTAMLTLSDAHIKNAGIYYFATLRSERKKGIGGAMMSEITRIAFERGHSVLTLQATPSGAPFYASLGFELLFSLPLHSFAEEVF